MIYYLRKMEHHTTQRRCIQRTSLHYLGSRKYCQYCLVNSTRFWLLEEYTHRYGKVHSCQTTMNAAEKYLKKKQERHYYTKEATPFICRCLMSLNLTQALTLLLLTNVIYRANLVASNYLRTSKTELVMTKLIGKDDYNTLSKLMMDIMIVIITNSLPN